MSLVAGDVGSKAILPDGAQIDHISENTVGHGSRVRGISDPTTYPVISGDIGEQIEASNVAFSVTTGVTNCVSRALPAGVWSVSASFGLNSTPSSRTYFNASLVTSNGTTAGTSYGKDIMAGATSITGGTYNNGAVTFTPRTITSTGSTVVYLNAQAAAASTSASDYGYITATRTA